MYFKCSPDSQEILFTNCTLPGQTDCAEPLLSARGLSRRYKGESTKWTKNPVFMEFTFWLCPKFHLTQTKHFLEAVMLGLIFGDKEGLGGRGGMRKGGVVMRVRVGAEVIPGSRISMDDGMEL